MILEERLYEADRQAEAMPQPLRAKAKDKAREIRQAVDEAEARLDRFMEWMTRQTEKGSER